MSRSINASALATLTGGLLLSASAFASTPLAQGYMLAADQAAAPTTDAKAKEASCGANKSAEAKCGADKAKAGEAKSGADKAKAGEAKSGADKAKADKAKAMEGKCGEGKCGGAA